MSIISIPYGEGRVSCELPDDRLSGVLVPKLHEFIPEKSGEELIRDAMEHPVGSPPLRELAKGKKRVVIIASDHTRPVPSRLIIPEMLRQIREGSPEAEITILVATGCHRPTRRDELIRKFGEEIVGRERIVIHDCDDKDGLVSAGTLPSGGELVLNRLAVECDLLAAEGFIEPHFFAGFSGGRKSVLPGIASRSTVLYNHNSAFIASPEARTGNLVGNPIHEDMVYAARRAKLAFIVNVAVNSEKKVIFASAGDMEKAHEEGCRFLNGLCRISAPEADIVITSNGGYPLDQNIYQAVKGMTAAEALVKKGGVIIMLARAEDGHGGDSFRRTFRDQPDLQAMMNGFLATPPDKTIVDQWQSQIFARVLMKAAVIFVSDAPDELVRQFHMIPAGSIEEAAAAADRILLEKGIRRGSILAVPDGVSVIAG